MLHLELNRPDQLNAMSPQMRDGLVDVFRHENNAPPETAARAILITGAGRGFCSGADLDPAVILDRRSTIGAEMEAGINQLVHLMRTIPVPVIAAVQGPADGGRERTTDDVSPGSAGIVAGVSALPVHNTPLKPVVSPVVSWQRWHAMLPVSHAASARDVPFEMSSSARCLPLPHCNGASDVIPPSHLKEAWT